MIFHDPHNQGLETFRNLITLLASPGHPTFDWFECDLGSRHRQTIPVPCSGSPSGLPFAPLKSLHLKLLQASLADAPHTVSVYSPSIASKASMNLMISSLSKQNIAKIGQPLAVGALYTARSLRLVGYTFGSCSADANEPQTAAKSVSNVIRSKHVQTQSASGFMESPVIVQILTVFRCDLSNVFQVEKKCGGHCWMMQCWADVYIYKSVHGSGSLQKFKSSKT